MDRGVNSDASNLLLPRARAVRAREFVPPTLPSDSHTPNRMSTHWQPHTHTHTHTQKKSEDSRGSSRQRLPRRARPSLPSPHVSAAATAPASTSLSSPADGGAPPPSARACLVNGCNKAIWRASLTWRITCLCAACGSRVRRRGGSRPVSVNKDARKRASLKSARARISGAGGSAARVNDGPRGRSTADAGSAAPAPAARSVGLYVCPG